MKKLIALLTSFVILLCCGCGGATVPSDKIIITATLFPQYDFARIIGGDKVDVTLLLPAGQESHLYDPSPTDMAKISQSDIFIYTGDVMEGWAGDIASSVGEDVHILDVSRNIELAESENDDDHEHSLDPHIWLDFENAQKMCVNIATELILLSPEDADYFTDNLTALLNDISALDKEYALLFENGQAKDLIFGGRFSVGYLTRRYDIKYKSAYASCSANSEPSVKDIAYLSDYVRQNDIKVVFCEEFSDPKIAREIAKANNAEVLVLHSCHNTSAEERREGATYLSIMTRNLENIRKGLQ